MMFIRRNAENLKKLKTSIENSMAEMKTSIENLKKAIPAEISPPLFAECKTPTDCVMSHKCMADAPCFCKNGKCKMGGGGGLAGCKTPTDCVMSGECMADAPCLCKNGK